MDNRVGVCIFDTGIDATHPEFEDRIVAFKDFVGKKDLPYDDNGHGTHVAGIVAGKKVGVYNKTNIISCKILNNKGNGKRNTICSASEWVIQNKEKYNIRVVNISVGAKLTVDYEAEARFVKCVEKLWDNGIVVVCAAGNNGPKAGSITTPGISSKVITIGSYDDKIYIDDNNVVHRDYSGRGEIKNCVIKPDFLAYGHNVLSAGLNGSYTIKSGTSMATPKISGLVAAILAKYPKMSPVDIKIKLRDFAIPLQMPVNRQGFGLIDVLKSIDKI